MDTKFKRIKPFHEYGTVGQRRYDGRFSEEFEPRLQGKKAIEVYKEMSMNDEIVAAILFAIEMLVKQADFFIEAGGKEEVDIRAQAFIEECLDDLNPGWDSTLTEILSFLVYGFSVHEICYKRRNGANRDPCMNSKYNDGLIGWSKFAVRAQDTLYEWIYDEHDHLVGYAQMAPPDYDVKIVPMDKALHFKTKSHKENPEGQSLLRTSYKSYYFKVRMQEIEGIGVERDLAGLPILRPDENTDIFDNTPETNRKREWAQQVISNLRRDALEGVLMPPGWEIELLSSGGSRQLDVGAIIERYDKRIAGTVMADFIMLGQDGTGSYALAQDKSSTFFMAITSFLDIITEVINNQAIPKLINLNGSHFEGITDYPKMVHSDIESRDLNELASYVQTLVNIGAITPDEELEKYLRQEADLPKYMDIEDIDTKNIQPEQNTDITEDTGQEDDRDKQVDSDRL